MECCKNEYSEINPINYSGTQINVWGYPTPEIASILDRRKQQVNPQIGYLTEQMLKVPFCLFNLVVNKLK